LKLSINSTNATADRVGFLLMDGTPLQPKGLRCRNATQSVTVFQNVVIDTMAKEIHVDDTVTFTYAQCGLTEGKVISAGAKEVTIFAYPVMTESDQFVGRHAYRLTAELL
jgi:hypothetical protein